MRLIGNAPLVADGATGLLTVDLSDPANPEIIHILDPGSASFLDVSNGLAGLIGVGIFYMVDVSDPAAPFLLGSTAVSGIGYEVKLNGALAVLGGFDGMRIVDFSDPSQPAVVGFTPPC